MKFSIYSKSKGLPREAKRSWGFTLIELLVVMAIAAAIMTSFVIQQKTWHDKLAVSNQAYEMTLLIRQAQIYALGVKEDKASTAADKFNVGYGVHVDSGDNDQYIFFADRDGDLKYDSGEALETPALIRGVVIDRVCGIHSGSERCSPNNSLRQIDVAFIRPDTKANISFLNNGGNAAPGFGPPATIYLESSGGQEYRITIQANGQISITQM